MLYEAYHFGACFGFWCTSSYDVLLHAYIFAFVMSFVVLTIRGFPKMFFFAVRLLYQRSGILAEILTEKLQAP